MKDSERLWQANDVARYLQASRSWVYEKAATGLLPSLRIGGMLRFEPEAVRAFAQGATRQEAQILPLNRAQRR